MALLKYIFILSLFLLFVIGFVVCPKIGVAKNLILNGGFEDALEFWYNPKKEIEVDEKIYHSGMASGRIAGEVGKIKSAAHLNVLIDPKSSYTLSIYIKTANITTADGGVSIWVQQSTRTEGLEWKSLGYITSGKKDHRLIATKGTHGWEKFEYEIKSEDINPNTSTFYIYVSLKDSEGTAWFDDLKLEEKGNKENLAAIAKLNLLKNSGFEEGFNNWSVSQKDYVSLSHSSYEGDKSLQVRIKPGEQIEKDITISQYVRIDPSKTYVFSYCGKGYKIHPQHAVCAEIELIGNGTPIGKYQVNSVSKLAYLGNPTTWQKRDIVIYGLNKHVTELKISLIFQKVGITEGKVWFDEVSLIENPDNVIDLKTDKPINIFLQGEPIVVSADIYGNRKEEIRLSYEIKDFWKNIVDTGGAQITVVPSKPFHRTITFHGLGYFEIFVRLHRDGKTQEKVISVGSLPSASTDYYEPDSKSIFGSWIGGNDYMKDIGVKWTRGEVSWKVAENKKGSIDESVMSGIEAQLKADRQKGLSRLMYFRSTPHWASTARQDDPSYPYHPPKNWDDLSNFVKYTVKRLGKYVNVWEVTNEPQYLAGFKKEDVVKFHKVVFEAIKEVQPDAIVLGPCTGTRADMIKYTKELFELGLYNYIDAVSVHTYRAQSGYLIGTPPEIPGTDYKTFLDDIADLQTLMNKYGAVKDIWITEMGWEMRRILGHEISEQDNANYMVRTFVQAKTNMNVKLLLWHCMTDYYSWDGTEKMSLLRSGAPSSPIAPRPGYLAYGIMTRNLYDTKYIAQWKLIHPASLGYAFKKSNGRNVLVLWNYDKQKRNEKVNMGSKIVTIMDIMGNEKTVATENGCLDVSLTESPIYLIW